MGTHPLNLAFRFLLEMSALVAVGTLGWARFEGLSRWGLALGLPVLFMVLWGTFAVPDDPSRSGGAPVPVSGAVRLLLELGLFAGAAGALHLAGHTRPAMALAIAVVLHYALSWDRIAWLLERA